MSERKKTKRVSLFVATIIGINAMIGAGIFTMPALLAKLAGPAGLISFGITALCVLSIVYSLGRLAALFPSEQWGYDYPARWGGRTLGIFTSYAYVLGVVLAMGFLAQQLGTWLTDIVPFSPLILGASVVAVLIGIVLTGAQMATWGQYLFVAALLIPMVLTIVCGFLNCKGTYFVPFAPYGWKGILAALPATLFSLLGFESIVSLSSIVEKPERNVPLAAVISVTFSAAFCILFVASIWAVVPQEAFSQGIGVTVASVMVKYVPQYAFLTSLMMFGAIFAIIGTLHSMLWSIGVLLYSVTKNLTTCSAISRVNGLCGQALVSERNGVLLVGILTILCMMLPLEALINIALMMIVPVYFCSAFALLFEKQEWKNGNNLIALVAVACSLILFGLACKGAWGAIVC